MNDTLLKLIIVMLLIAVIFTIMGFVLGYNTPQMQGIYSQINATQGYAVNMTNAFNNTNNVFVQTYTGWLAPIESMLGIISNVIYKIGILLYNFFALLFEVFSIAFAVIFVVMPAIFNTSGLGVLSNIASLVYDITIGILTITIAIYILNFVRGRNNV